MLKSVLVVVAALVAGPMLTALPAAAQEALAARTLTEVCLPYANRVQSLEKSVRAARALEFRRSVADTAPLDDWASEVELVSKDGVWRLRIEEGSVEHDGVPAYRLSCSISSQRASARELADLGRRAFRNEVYWSSPVDNAWRWDRRHASPGEYALAVEVSERPGPRPAMVVTGAYF